MGNKLDRGRKSSGPRVWLTIGILLAAAAGIFSSAEYWEDRNKIGERTKMAEGELSESGEPAERMERKEEKSGKSGDKEGQTEETQTERVLESYRPIFDCLYHSMKSGNLALAAACLEENKGELEALFGQLEPGERFLYDGARFSGKPEGLGIVLQAPSVVFYGRFREGRPEGFVTAIKSIVLSKARYDYSIGEWRNGRMNGFGVTGYTYYNGPGEEDGFKIEKSGRFLNDQMEGRVRYISIDQTGDSFTWEIEVKKGVTLLDHRWRFDSLDKQFHLPAENDKTHIYLLSTRDEGRALWQNRIVWTD